MALLAIPAKRSLIYSDLLLVASWAVLVLCAATEKASPSCPFSSPAFSDDHHHHAHHHHDHDHDHDHDHHHHHHLQDHDHDHDHHLQDHDHDQDHHHDHDRSRKLPEELAEEEDLAREGFGFNHYGHRHHHHFHSNDGYEHEISRLGIWVRAMGCSLLVSMASLICLIILPLIFFQGKPSRAVVDCLAVFGAGAMLGDAFLHQLPHAFGSKHSHSHDDHVGSFGEADHAHGHSHAHSLEDLSVGLSMLLGIVLFFLVEKIVRYVEDHSANGTNDRTHGHHHHKRQQKLKHDGEDTNQQLSDSKNRETVDMISEKELNGQSDARLKNDENDKRKNLHKRTNFDGVVNEDEKDVDSRNVQGIQKQPSLNETVPVHTSSNLVFGYLNLFSDGVHNFTDGMALGSAFLLHGTVGGWSRTLFLLAHELPQEVGDFGILVRSGFAVSKALFFNFLSALVALAGTALALVLGKDPGQSSLIEVMHYVFPNLFWRPQLIKKVPCGGLAAHVCRDKSSIQLQSKFYWPHMRWDVSRFVVRCSVCHSYEGNAQNSGLYMPLPISDSSYEDLSIDFILGLLKSKQGIGSIMVIIDKFSKIAHFFSCKKTFDALNIGRLSFKEIVRLHGLPHSSTSNCDVKFISHFWRELWK